MSRICTICNDRRRESIDHAVVNGEPYRSIAKRFDVSESALFRHKADHLPAKLLRAEGVREKLSAERLLEQLHGLHERTLNLLESAETEGNRTDALRAIHQCRENLKLMAQLVGELPVEGSINLHISPQWLELRTVIVTALTDHPEAKRAVLQALGDTNAPD